MGLDLIRFSRHPTNGDNGRRGGAYGILGLTTKSGPTLITKTGPTSSSQKNLISIS